MNEAQEAFLGEVRRLLGPPVYINPDEVPFVEISDPDRLCQAPLVSVVCLTYNHAKYIERTFQGFKEQITNFPVEIIIGEDYSTDITLELCKDFQSRYPNQVRVLTWEKNVGLTANFLRTERACRGKYIAYCEGDDYWCCPTKLQQQYDYLEANKACGLIHGNAMVVHPGRTAHACFFNPSKPLPLPLMSGHSVVDMLNDTCSVVTCTVMIRREVLIQLGVECPGVYTRVRRLGDFQVWTGMLSRSKAQYLPEVLAGYVQSGESATRSNNPKKRLLFFCDMIDVFLEINAAFNNSDKGTEDGILRRLSSALLFVAYRADEKGLVSATVRMRKVLGYRNKFSDSVFSISNDLHLPFWVALVLLRIIHPPMRVIARFRQGFNHKRNPN